MAKRPAIASQDGAAWMDTTTRDVVAPDAVSLAVNMLPVDPSRPNSEWAAVGNWHNIGTGTAGGSDIMAHGTLTLATGVRVRWQLSATTGIWTLSGTSYTNSVTSANFTTASITLPTTSRAVYWVEFNHTLIVTDDSGTQVPWRWDGTSGAASLTELTNAPPTLCKPAVYYGKLFLVKSTERNTLVWSEENDPTTGYEAGGLNNAWTLSQTGSGNIFAIAAGNEGLYYARTDKIGVIRGAVNDTFVTSGTLSDIALIGTNSPAGLSVLGADLWVWTGHAVFVILQGSTEPRQVWAGPGASQSLDLGMGVIATTALSVGDDTNGPIVIPQSGRAGDIDYPTIWYQLSRSNNADHLCLVIDAVRYRPLAYVIPYGGNTARRLSAYYTSNSASPIPSLADTTTGRIMVYGDSSDLGIMRTALADTNASGTYGTTVRVLVGRPLPGGSARPVQYQFDRLQTTFNVSGAGNDPDQVTVGWNQYGRYVKPVLSLSTATTTFTASARAVTSRTEGTPSTAQTLATGSTTSNEIRWYGWTVYAFPTDDDPVAP